ncbi:MAG: cellulase family glycosylhydrolase, partial [Sphingobium sp.]
GAEADIINLEAYGFGKFEHLASRIIQRNGYTEIVMDDYNTIKLTGVVATDLSASNFKFSAVVSPSSGPLSVGVNISGAENGLMSGGKTGADFFPTQKEIAYFAGKGMDNIRVPISWELLQPSLNGSLSTSYVEKLHAVVSYAKSLGLEVIIDLHNYGMYNGNLIGSAQVPTSAFANVWSKLADSFKDDANVTFGLMNEPQQATAAAWLPMVNAAIASIRATGATQEILVPGIDWSGGQSWMWNGNATVLGKQGAIVDPLNNFAFEVHQYLDDSSGQYDWVVSETIGVERLAQVTDWARVNGYRLHLGETGVSESATALKALDNMLSFMKGNEDVWSGVSYWASGAVWRGVYMYGIDPVYGILDDAQMDILEKYADGTVIRTALGGGLVQVDIHANANNAISSRDILDANEHLISRTFYDPSGHATTGYVQAKDGSIAIYDFAPSGVMTGARIINSVGRTVEAGVGHDTLVLKVAQDFYSVNVQFQVLVDGVQVGGTYDVNAIRKVGQDVLTLHGDWGAGAHNVSIKYINDGRNPNDATQDRNLHIHGVIYNGVTVSNTLTSMYSNNTVTMQTPASSPAGTWNSDHYDLLHDLIGADTVLHMI